MNRALLRLSLACLAMFVLLLLNVNYVQAFKSSSLATKSGNVRVFDQQFQYQRGSIKAGNTTIAGSRPIKKGGSTYQRFYPDGPAYAPVTGYDSIYGATGLEAAENKELAGTDPRLAVHNLISLITGKPRLGGTVYTTLSPVAQQAAYAALKAQGHDAAAVAIDPRTGKILALASFPTYNPNRYTTLSGTRLNKIDAAYRKDKSQPLLNRATQVTFPPGSSFKVITSSAALTTGTVASPQSPVDAPTSLTLPGSDKPLINDGGEVCGDGHPPLIFAFTLSCNTAFGELGIKLKSRTLRDYANRFGFNNSSLNVPIPVAASVFPQVSDPAFTAYSAIGQYNDQVTPFEEAMIAATIANKGTLMTPYLVKQIQAPDLSTIANTTPKVLSQAIAPNIAADLTTMMISVTQNPSGTAYATANQNVAGVEIAGKTGTAQNGINNSGLNDAVFTCFAPANNPQIAVGVIVKGGGFGADAAAPIAVKIIRAYLGIK
ncbi:MAG: penicillin-binding protein 2 [Actinomycetota bacterium]